MVSSVTSSSSNYLSNTRAKNSTSTNQQSFQEVLSETHGYDISNMDTAKSKGKFTPGSILDEAELILPTFDNLREMTSQLNTKLSEYLKESGITSNPPFDIKLNPYDNSIGVTGDRDDLEKIQELLNDNEEIRDMVQTISAVGSVAINAADSIAFQKEYLESNNPESVVAKYSHLFNDNRRMHDFSLRFDGSFQILSDNEEWDYPSV